VSTVTFTIWYIVVGLLLVTLAMAGSVLKRLPLSTAMLYLVVGLALGPGGAGLITLDAIDGSKLLERLTEIAVIVSLFAAGLKMRLPLNQPRWGVPIRLASISMVITVAMIAAAGVWLLNLPLGVAIVLGAVLAPTDPVLASDVQMEHPADRDRLRFGLTGEAGLNDGTAFPFVMLGLAMMDLHEIGESGWRWVAVDLVWAIVGGLAIGAVCGTVVARLVLYLRKTHKEAVGLDEFLSLGLLATAYGLALLAHSYGFLAAFAAGVAMRQVESHQSSGDPPHEALASAAAEGHKHEVATDPEKAPAYMAAAVLGFNEQLERICEVAIVLLVGGMLTDDYRRSEAIWFVPLLFLLIRPVSVYLGLLGTKLDRTQRGLVAWFGVRGVGSIYYLMYALEHGVSGESAKLLTGLTLSVVAASVVLHGVSVTPLMRLYERTRRGRGGVPSPGTPRES
jgi:NhaP-type Na+/H+ or K+/H+ antiporter